MTLQTSARGATVLPALSVTQPWATLIAQGHKRYETRSWRTSYRGRLAIHAARRFPPEAQDFAAEERAIGRLPERIPFGALVATARLVAVHRTEDIALTVNGLERLLGDFGPGRYAWELDEVTVLAEPVPCRGSLGLWALPPPVAALLIEGPRA